MSSSDQFFTYGPKGESENGEPFRMGFGIAGGPIPNDMSREDAWKALGPDGEASNPEALMGAVLLDNSRGIPKALPFDPENATDVEGAKAFQRYLDGEFDSPFTALFTAKKERGETVWNGVKIDAILAHFEREENTEICPASWSLDYLALDAVLDILKVRGRGAAGLEGLRYALAAIIIQELSKELLELKPEGLEIPTPHELHNILEEAKGWTCPHKAEDKEVIEALDKLFNAPPATRPEPKAKPEGESPEYDWGNQTGD